MGARGEWGEKGMEKGKEWVRMGGMRPVKGRGKGRRYNPLHNSPMLAGLSVAWSVLVLRCEHNLPIFFQLLS